MTAVQNSQISNTWLWNLFEIIASIKIFLELELFSHNIITYIHRLHKILIHIYNSCIRLYLDYVIFSSRGDRCTLSPLVCLSGSLIWYIWSWPDTWWGPLLDPCARFGHLRWCSWGVGMVWRILLVLASPGALTRIGLSWLRLPTTGAENLSCALAPWNPGFTAVWPTPKWWQSYSWCICTSFSRVFTTLLRGDWLSSSV